MFIIILLCSSREHHSIGLILSLRRRCFFFPPRHLVPDRGGGQTIFRDARLYAPRFLIHIIIIIIYNTPARTRFRKRPTLTMINSLCCTRAHSPPSVTYKPTRVYMYAHVTIIIVKWRTYYYDDVGRCTYIHYTLIAIKFARARTHAYRSRIVYIIIYCNIFAKPTAHARAMGKQ